MSNIILGTIVETARALIGTVMEIDGRNCLVRFGGGIPDEWHNSVTLRDVHPVKVTTSSGEIVDAIPVPAVAPYPKFVPNDLEYRGTLNTTYQLAPDLDDGANSKSFVGAVPFTLNDDDGGAWVAERDTCDTAKLQETSIDMEHLQGTFHTLPIFQFPKNELPKALTYDEGKEPLANLPWDAIDAMSRVQMFGHDKYGDFNNYRKGMEISRNLSCALRHIRDYIKGKEVDESGENPLANAMCRLSFVLQNLAEGTAIDDRYKPKARKVDTAVSL